MTLSPVRVRNEPLVSGAEGDPFATVVTVAVRAPVGWITTMLHEPSNVERKSEEDTPPRYAQVPTCVPER